MKKRIVIISGVTGAIGSSLFAEYAQDSNIVIYGISRRALPVSRFVKNGKLPLNTLICSLKNKMDYESLFKHVQCEDVSEVIYVHSLGLYPFEVNKKGQIVIENDKDGDGINDEVTELTLHTFIAATESLKKYWTGKTKLVIFGGLADKHRPAVHQSWWKTIEQVKVFLREESAKNPNLASFVYNISSVICPHEVITRPFVFIETDADQTRWLHPHELARSVVKKTKRNIAGYYEIEKFRKKCGFKFKNYYTDTEFTPRKVKELY